MKLPQNTSVLGFSSSNIKNRGNLMPKYKIKSRLLNNFKLKAALNMNIKTKKILNSTNKVKLGKIFNQFFKIRLNTSDIKNLTKTDRYKFLFLQLISYLDNYALAKKLGRLIFNFRQIGQNLSAVQMSSQFFFTSEFELLCKVLKFNQAHTDTLINPTLKTNSHLIKKQLSWLKTKLLPLYYFDWNTIIQNYFYSKFNKLLFQYYVRGNRGSVNINKSYIQSLVLIKQKFYYVFLKLYKYFLLYITTYRSQYNSNILLNFKYNDLVINSNMNRICCFTKTVEAYTKVRNTKADYFSWLLTNYNKTKILAYVNTKRTVNRKINKFLIQKRKQPTFFTFAKFRILYIKLRPINSNLFLTLFIKNKNSYKLLYSCSYGLFKITKKKMRKTIFALKQFKKIIRKFLKLYLKAFIKTKKPFELLKQICFRYVILDIPQPYRNKYINSVLTKLFKKFYTSKFTKANNRKKYFKYIPPSVYKSLTIPQKKIILNKKIRNVVNLRKPHILLTSLKNLAHNGTRLKKPKRL